MKKRLLIGVGLLFIFLLLVTYSKYQKKYPQTQRYPVRLMTITEDYNSYWEYMRGNKTIIINSYNYQPDTTTIKESWLDPIYEIPDL